MRPRSESTSTSDIYNSEWVRLCAFYRILMSEKSPTEESAVAESSTMTVPPSTEVRFAYISEYGRCWQVRYDPRSNATGNWRITEEWTGCIWLTTGPKVVVNVLVNVTQGENCVDG